MDAELIELLIGLAIFLLIVFAMWVWDKLCYTPWLKKEQNRQELDPVRILDDFNNKRYHDAEPWG